MPETTALSPTLEDYLEAICRLVSEKGEAHVNDIAAATSVHKSTVTAALKSLSDKRLVAYVPYQAATLTPKGQKVAGEIIRRHEVVRDFLRNVLGVPEDVADDNACRMEHAMDAEVLNRLTLFIRFVWECPRAGEDWVEHFRLFFESGGEHRIDAQEAMEWAERFKESVRNETGQEKRQRMTTLDQLKPGQKGKIVKVGGSGGLKRRIVDMGVVRGTPVEVVKIAPLGDPIDVKIKGYHLSLRKAEAASISIEAEA